MRRILGQLAAMYAQNRLLTVLVAVLVALVGFWGMHTGRVWYFEGQLRHIADDIMAEEWADLAPSIEDRESDIDVNVNCTFAYLVFGEKTGKIALIVRPRPNARSQQTHEVAYLYTYDTYGWTRIESFAHPIRAVR